MNIELPIDIGSRVRLNNGVLMPWFGLGLYKAVNGEETERAIAAAIDAGYRGFDTAALYGNEESTGRALRSSGLARDDYFIATKVWNDDQGYDATLRACETSLRNLGMDHVDLYLIHWPLRGLFLETWRALERIYRDGKTRAIGVCNFTKRHMQELLNQGGTTPAINQVEFHPLLFQRELLTYCREQGMALQAWRPLTRGEIFGLPQISELSRRYHKTPAQIILRWDIQHGVITIPKSVTPERIRSNAEIFDFSLDEDAMAAIDALDRGTRLGPDPDSF